MDMSTLVVAIIIIITIDKMLVLDHPHSYLVVVYCLGEEMDVTMARMEAADKAANVYGGCGPRLNKKRDASYWYANGGAKPPLANEKPAGVTVNYDALVERWAKK